MTAFNYFIIGMMIIVIALDTRTITLKVRYNKPWHEVLLIGIRTTTIVGIGVSLLFEAQKTALCFLIGWLIVGATEAYLSHKDFKKKYPERKIS